MGSSNKNYTVQSVERAIKILESLNEKDDGISLTNLSEEIGLHKSTVHRLITTLSNHGYVEQDSITGHYKLGLKFLTLSNNVLNKIDIRRIGSPFLKELNATTNEVVHLVILNSFEAVYIDKIDSYQTITINSSIGKVVPVHCTAAGKVLVSHLSDEKVLGGLVKKGMKKYTENTIMDPNEFLRELRKVREQGFAIDDNEHESNIRCIAAPIKNYKGDIVAAISIAGPVSRISRERIDELKKLVLNTSKKISERLGFQHESNYYQIL